MTDFIAAIIPTLYGEPERQVYSAKDLQRAAAISLLVHKDKLDGLDDTHEIIVEWVPQVRIYKKDAKQRI